MRMMVGEWLSEWLCRKENHFERLNGKIKDSIQFFSPCKDCLGRKKGFLVANFLGEYFLDL